MEDPNTYLDDVSDGIGELLAEAVDIFTSESNDLHIVLSSHSNDV